MKVFVVGASGMTGSPLVQQLLDATHQVKVIVRSKERFHAKVPEHPNLTVFEAAILDVSDIGLQEYIRDCQAIVSCLGHVLSFSGVFGHPRKLCTDAVKKLCAAIEATPTSTASEDNEEKRKFILMGTVGVANPELNETRGFGDRFLLRTLHYTLPPHADNETAAAYLNTNIGKENSAIEWCIVRPDSLIDGEVSEYVITESPTTTITGGIDTTRSNVANFMMKLIEDKDGLWQEWKFRMPCIKNDVDSKQVKKAKDDDKHNSSQ